MATLGTVELVVGRSVLSLAGLALLACQFSALGTGEANEGSGSTMGQTQGTMSTAAGDDASSGASGSGVATDPTTATSTSTSTSTSAGTNDATGDGSTGEDMEGLSGEGLIVRYFLDEDSADFDAGGPVRDAAPSPLDLEVIRDQGQPVHSAAAGRQAAAYSSAGDNGWIIASIEDTKLYQRLDGARALTMEAVVEIRAADSMASRIIHIGQPGSDDAVLALTIRSDGRVELRWNESVDSGVWINAGVLGTGRHVLHVVVDVDATTRASLYVDGQMTAPTGAIGPAGGTPLLFPPELDLVLFNRPTGDRSFEGLGHYAAIYDAAFVEERVKAHTDALLASDDG